MDNLWSAVKHCKSEAEQVLYIQNRCNLCVLHVLERKRQDEKPLEAL